MKLTARIMHRKTRWIAASLLAIAGATFATTSALAARGQNPRIRALVAPQLTREFSVFRAARAREADASPTAVAAGHPALQQQLETMMQPNDPTDQYQLDFAAAVLQQTQQGPALLIPGTSGACILIQVPAGITSGEVGAATACNSTANIAKNGGLAAVYSDQALQVQVAYGMTADYAAEAHITRAGGRTTSTRVHTNAYAFNVRGARRVVLASNSGRAAKVIVIRSLPRLAASAGGA